MVMIMKMHYWTLWFKTLSMDLYFHTALCSYYVDNYHHNVCCWPTYNQPITMLLMATGKLNQVIRINKRKINVDKVVDMKSC